MTEERKEHLLNEILGNVGKTVRFGPEWNVEGQATFAQVTALFQDARAGKVGVLFLDGLDPMHALPVDAGVKEALGVPELVVAARAESRVRSLEATLSDGKTKVVLRAAPAADSTLLIVENVTEQRELLQQLTRAQKLEVVGALAGGIAHDFNNLLTAAMVGTGLARHGLENEPADTALPAESLEQVERALEKQPC